MSAHSPSIGRDARVQRRARLRVLWEEQCGLCWYCAKPVQSRAATIDHVVPQVDGGTNEYENTVMACAPCNARKGARHTRRLKTPGRLAALLERGGVRA